MVVDGGGDWQERLRRAEQEVAAGRERRRELEEILAALSRLSRAGPASSDAVPPPPGPSAVEATAPAAGPSGAETAAGGAAAARSTVAPRGEGPPPAGGTPGDGGQEGGGSDGGGPGGGEGGPGRGGAGWKTRWRQAILERDPQLQLERGAAVAATLAARMRSVEEAMDAACRLCAEVASGLKTGAAQRPFPLPVLREAVSSDVFRRLIARLLADLLREPTAVHPGRAGHAGPGRPEAPSWGKEVALVKGQEMWWWWLLIILLVVLLFFFFTPLGNAAGQ